MKIDEIIEIAEKCIFCNAYDCRRCKLFGDLYCKTKIISALLDELNKREVEE